MTDTPSSSAPSPTAPAPKKRSLGKLLTRLFIICFLLFCVGLVALYFSKDMLVRAGVVRGGKYATQQDTRLVQANLALFGGALTLENFGIKNLKDFKEADLLTMGKCTTTFDTGSIFSKEVVINDINIHGLELTLEQNGARNNINELMAVLQKNTAAANTTTTASNAPPGKQLRIKKLTLTGTKIHVRAAPINLDFDLGPIEMTDPTNPDGRPMKIADLVARVILHVSKQAMEDPRLPLDVKQSMKNVTAVVNNLKGQLDKGVKDLTKGIDGITKDPLKAIQSGDVNKTLQDAQKNIQNLNPFGNPTTTKPK